MKKISVLFLGTVMCLQGWAQNSKVTSSIMHIQQYNQGNDTNEIIEAKAAIDEAAVNDKTKDEPKMYLSRGEVYVIYFGIRLNNIVSKLMLSEKKSPDKARSEAYVDIDTSVICIAANSFMKVLELAPKDYYSEEAKEAQNLPMCRRYLENTALSNYYASKYSTSLALYKKIIAICKSLNITDSTYKNNVEMAANSADAAGDKTTALMYYQQLMDLKYGGAAPYRSIAAMYLKQSDSAKAWDYIEKGRGLYPEDLSLIVTETNFYILKHNYEKAESNLVLTINKLQQRPDKDKNKALLTSLYTNLGGIYEHKANPKDASGNDMPKPADYDSLFAKADSNYAKALAIDPNNFDVLFASGALFFNRAVPITKQADALPYNASTTDKYDKLMAQAKVYFLQAQPYFEKAYKINPNDQSNANALTQVYANTGQNDKIEAMKNKK